MTVQPSRRITGFLEFGAGGRMPCSSARPTARPAGGGGGLADLAAAMKGTRELRAESLLQARPSRCRCCAWEAAVDSNADRPHARGNRGRPMAVAPGPCPASRNSTGGGAAATFSHGRGFVRRVASGAAWGTPDGQRVLAALEGSWSDSDARAAVTPLRARAAVQVDWASVGTRPDTTRLFRVVTALRIRTLRWRSGGPGWIRPKTPYRRARRQCGTVVSSRVTNDIYTREDAVSDPQWWRCRWTDRRG